MRNILIAIALLLLSNAAHAEFLGFGKKDPIDINDARAVLSMLRPASRGGNFDVYLSMHADGSMYLMFKLSDHSEVTATGGDLKAIVEDLVGQLDNASVKAKSAAEAARAVLNQGKASQ